MCPLSTDPEEWIYQAKRDLKTAAHVAKDKQRYYALFFCHLAVEKALKGLYFKRLGTVAPKTHNLSYLLEKVNEKPPEDLFKFIMRLNEVNVITRYPEDISKIQQEFSPEFVAFALKKSKEIIEWINSKF